MRRLGVIFLFSLPIAPALAQANSWRRDYDASVKVMERAMQSGSDRGMREVRNLATDLGIRAKADLPEKAGQPCAFAAFSLANVALSLSDNKTVAAERDHRLWQQNHARCTKGMGR